MSTDAVDDVRAMASLATPMAVRVMATLRVADHIASGRRSAPDIADAAQANPDALDRLLRHLCTVGLLRSDEPGRYALTSRGDALRDDHPAGLRAVLDIGGAVGRADLSFVGLLESVRLGEPAFPMHFGRSFWSDLASDPVRAASFDAQMGADIAADAPAIAAAYDWAALEHVVDVGGGDGTLLIAMLRAHPSLRGTIVDLPHAVDAARQAVDAAGLANRAAVISGSFFDPLPPGAGGYVLSAVLHNWNDDAARVILRRCADAADNDGVVLVIEKIGADGGSLRTEMDLRMLTYFGGRERSVAEIDALATTAALGVAAVHHAGDIAMIELSTATHRRGSGMRPTDTADSERSR